MVKLGYEDIGDGYIVRVDSVRSVGGESYFEVHVYEDSKRFRKAAAALDQDGLRGAEVNTLTTHGEWGKHGKPSQAPNLGKQAQEGLNTVIQREVQSRGWAVRGLDGGCSSGRTYGEISGSTVDF